MKTTLTTLAILAVIPTSVALADDDCRVPMANWQPHTAVMQLAEENGWMVREIEIDDGCYEVEARTRDGREIEATLDPRTLVVIEIEDEDDDRIRSARGSIPAGTVVPSQNGLFDSATPPQVKSN